MLLTTSYSSLIRTCSTKHSSVKYNSCTIPANIRLDEDVLKTSFFFISRRSLQDVLIKTNIFGLALRLQKTSWSRPIYSFSRRLQDILPRRLAKTSSRHLRDLVKTFWRLLQDVFKTSSRRLVKTFSRRLQNVFCKNIFKTFAKTSSRHLQKRLQDIFKTSSIHLQDIYKTSCKDIFKRCSRHIIKLNCSC